MAKTLFTTFYFGIVALLISCGGSSGASSTPVTPPVSNCALPDSGSCNSLTPLSTYSYNGIADTAAPPSTSSFLGGAITPGIYKTTSFRTFNNPSYSSSPISSSEVYYFGCGREQHLEDSAVPGAPYRGNDNFTINATTITFTATCGTLDFDYGAMPYTATSTTITLFYSGAQGGIPWSKTLTKISDLP
jgi:hypothetical protein